jgi:uncharacterized protein YbbK (DUF523 family)
MSHPLPSTPRISIGISSCLMGEDVRYDGGNCYASLIVERLNDAFELHPICPEMGIGMGAPRAPIQLIDTGEGIYARGTDDRSLNVTNKLEQFAIGCLAELPTLYGYIFKAHSPSCGIQNTNVFNKAGKLLDSNGTGIHAMTIIKNRTNLPVACENQLQDIESIEEYRLKVVSYYQLRNP